MRDSGRIAEIDFPLLRRWQRRSTRSIITPLTQHTDRLRWWRSTPATSSLATRRCGGNSGAPRRRSGAADAAAQRWMEVFILSACKRRQAAEPIRPTPKQRRRLRCGRKKKGFENLFPSPEGEGWERGDGGLIVQRARSKFCRPSLIPQGRGSQVQLSRNGKMTQHNNFINNGEWVAGASYRPTSTRRT